MSSQNSTRLMTSYCACCPSITPCFAVWKQMTLPNADRNPRSSFQASSPQLTFSMHSCGCWILDDLVWKHQHVDRLKPTLSFWIIGKKFNWIRLTALIWSSDHEWLLISTGVLCSGFMETSQHWESNVLILSILNDPGDDIWCVAAPF